MQTDLSSAVAGPSPADSSAFPFRPLLWAILQPWPAAAPVQGTIRLTTPTRSCITLCMVGQRMTFAQDTARRHTLVYLPKPSCCRTASSCCSISCSSSPSCSRPGKARTSSPPPLAFSCSQRYHQSRHAAPLPHMNTGTLSSYSPSHGAPSRLAKHLSALTGDTKNARLLPLSGMPSGTRVGRPHCWCRR